VVPAVLQGLEKYSIGKAGKEESGTFSDSWAWTNLLPLAVVNWGSAGDMLDTNTVTGSLYPSFSENGILLNGSVFYDNMATRFDIGAGLLLDSEFDYDTDIRTDDLAAVFRLKFPFDAYRSLTGGVIAGRKTWFDGSIKLSERDRAGVFLEASHDNRLFRALNHIRGQRLALGIELFPSDTSSLEEYTTLYGSFVHAFGLAEDHILSVGLQGTLSFGRDREAFDIADAVRGYEDDIMFGAKALSMTLEYRFPVYRDGNWAVAGHYLLLKDIRGFLFFDAGAVSNLPLSDFLSDFSSSGLDFRHSAGAGIQLYLYGLQKGLFGIRAGIAAITDSEDDRVSAFLNLQFEF
jgi:outer membrane protein assembly factor BamA